MVALNQLGVRVSNEGVCLVGLRTAPEQIEDALRQLQKNGKPDPEELAKSVSNKRTAKYDWLLGDDLASASYASKALDVDGAWALLDSL